MQHAYEYDGTAMVRTKWPGIELSPKCEVCGARQCDGHGQYEIELKAFCDNVPIKSVKSKEPTIPQGLTEEEKKTYKAYLGENIDPTTTIIDHLASDHTPWTQGSEKKEIQNPYTRNETMGPGGTPRYRYEGE